MGVTPLRFVTPIASPLSLSKCQIKSLIIQLRFGSVGPDSVDWTLPPFPPYGKGLSPVLSSPASWRFICTTAH
jgi:hypothetical protein